jgi:hypothetical protein
MALKGQFWIGEPVQYQSMYHYQKWRFPVISSETGSTVGWVKQERVVDENGDESSSTYYTRDFDKPYGMKRFYSSPQALVIALGGQIDRTKPNPLAAVLNTPADEPLLNETTGEVEPETKTPIEKLQAKLDDPVLDAADIAVLAMVVKPKVSKKAFHELNADVVKSKANSARALKGAATKAANKLAKEKQDKKDARALAKKKKLAAAKRVAKKQGQAFP